MNSSSSLAAAIADRAFATLLSKISRSSLRELTAGAGALLRSLDIRVVGTVEGQRLNRTLLLELTEDRWSCTAWYLDRADLPAPGVADGGVPLDAVDVVVGRPCQRTSPSRRAFA